MLKLILFPVLIVIACLVSGAYGMLHNQISYTVSPDYFHAFKFHQFGIPEELRNRFGAAIVGWRAAWWMGFIIGVPVLFVGLIIRDAHQYAKHGLLSMLVVAVTTLVVGLAALAYAMLTFTQDDARDFGLGISNKLAFAHAGAMHNFSYIGGFCGIMTGIVYLVIAKVRISRSSKSVE